MYTQVYSQFLEPKIDLTPAKKETLRQKLCSLPSKYSSIAYILILAYAQKVSLTPYNSKSIDGKQGLVIDIDKLPTELLTILFNFIDYIQNVKQDL